MFDRHPRTCLPASGGIRGSKPFLSGFPIEVGSDEHMSFRPEWRNPFFFRRDLSASDVMSGSRDDNLIILFDIGDLSFQFLYPILPTQSLYLAVADMKAISFV